MAVLDFGHASYHVIGTMRTGFSSATVTAKGYAMTDSYYLPRSITDIDAEIAELSKLKSERQVIKEQTRQLLATLDKEIAARRARVRRAMPNCTEADHD
jgi:hypothetical protein